jgi:hypothetical protein
VSLENQPKIQNTIVEKQILGAKKAAEDGHHRSASAQKLAWISASDAVALWNVKKKPKISS